MCVSRGLAVPETESERRKKAGLLWREIRILAKADDQCMTKADSRQRRGIIEIRSPRNSSTRTLSLYCHLIIDSTSKAASSQPPFASWPVSKKAWGIAVIHAQAHFSLCLDPGRPLLSERNQFA